MKNLLFLTFGTFLFALSITQFAMSNNLAEGGIAGLALLLFFAFGLSPAIVTFIFNAVLLAIGYRVLPKHMIYKSLLNVPLFSLFVYLMEDWGQPMADPLLAAIFTGVFTGAGFGFIFQAGSTTGGTSTVARMLNHKFGWELTGANFVLDAVIVGVGIFIIGPLHTMYTIVALYVGKKITDYVLEGFQSRKALNVISTKGDDIADAVIRLMNSSATIYEAYGSFSQKKHQMVYIVIEKQRLFHLKQMVYDIDPNAFIVVYTVKDVSGGTFLNQYHPSQKSFPTKDTFEDEDFGESNDSRSSP
ncbi:YitT family protein [Salicibibacter cibarius]|uniref:YitT family protein n=1 Tax=Salicibibacter cibarius TaxID=2743000 RepID=A0A7T6Z1P3_9BACI|nr:YitT family protein [Salicibibacter cibarius]QQK75358.1 YitT family protein [Salicibibacter cibarius]